MPGKRLFRDERKQRGAVLRVMCLALMMVVGAVASLNVALPEIARSTGATQTQLQWIVTAYALAFAALLLPAGAIGDRIGRKPVLAAGLGLFGLSSLAAIFVERPRRADRTARCHGRRRGDDHAGDAVRDHDRLPARGARQGRRNVGRCCGGRRCARPARLGRPARVAPLAVDLRPQRRPGGRRTRRDARDRAGHPRDAAAAARPRRHAALGGGSRGARLRHHRRPRARLGRADDGRLAGVRRRSESLAFVLWELRRREPMLDPRHFARRGFAAGTLSMTVQFFAAFGFLFLALPYLQLVMGYSPLQAAGALVPMALVVIPLSRTAPAIAARLGVRVAGATGLSLMALGFIVLSTLEVGSSYAHFLAGLLPFGAGMALAGAPATTAIVASLPRSKQGVASAVNDVSRELGGALGIAVLGSLINGVYRAEMADSTGAFPPAPGRRRTGRSPPPSRSASSSGRRATSSCSTRRPPSCTASPAASSPVPRSCSSARSSSPSGHRAAPSPGRTRPGSRSAPSQRKAPDRLSPPPFFCREASSWHHHATRLMTSDPYDLERFVAAQDARGTYASAVAELRAGRKVGHWMWFVFPQVAGLGMSAMSRRVRDLVARGGAPVPRTPDPRASGSGSAHGLSPSWAARRRSTSSVASTR